eukprot:6138747-Pyramimonas_sp.AAC.1
MGVTPPPLHDASAHICCPTVWGGRRMIAQGPHAGPCTVVRHRHPPSPYAGIPRGSVGRAWARGARGWFGREPVAPERPPQRSDCAAEIVMPARAVVAHWPGSR